MTFSLELCSFPFGARLQLLKSAELTNIVCTARVESLILLPSNVQSNVLEASTVV